MNRYINVIILCLCANGVAIGKKKTKVPCIICSAIINDAFTPVSNKIEIVFVQVFLRL